VRRVLHHESREPSSVGRKLLFLVTEDWFFCSHFIDRAKAASEAGFDVLVLANINKDGGRIKSAGLRLIPLSINRRSLNPISSLLTLLQIIRIYFRERPTIVHHVAYKPILLGSIATRMVGVRHVVNALVGGGYIFTSDRPLMRLLRSLIKLALRITLNRPGSRVVFENADDLSAFVQAKVVSQEHAVLIRGAGVEPSRYQHDGTSSCLSLVVLAARLLWDKGIGEFVEAARILRSRRIPARFVIIGDVDTGNRASIDPETLKSWCKEGAVELWGFRNDIPIVLAQASIACLPSYREGLPKFLLEAMASGLPCVTTDVPGCREAVTNDDNGLLVPARDGKALANAIEKLLLNPELRNRMGQRGRQRVENEFSTTLVVGQTLALYQEMLSR